MQPALFVIHLGDSISTTSIDKSSSIYYVPSSMDINTTDSIVAQPTGGDTTNTSGGEASIIRLPCTDVPNGGTSFHFTTGPIHLNYDSDSFFLERVPLNSLIKRK